MLRAALILAFVGGVAILSAQSPDARRADTAAFDAASVKISQQVQAGIMRRPTPGRVLFQNVPLHILVEEAFDVKPYQVVGMPAWVNEQRFDIVATYDPALATQVPLMLQRLLTDRFRMRSRREIREMPIYELVKARTDGTLEQGLRASTTDCTPAAGQRSPCTMRITASSIEATGMRWGFLPTNIGVWDRPVIDKSGLSGSFDVKLEWTPDPAMARFPQAAAAAASTASAVGERVSIFTALQEQLGLKLQPASGPVEVLVIESVERPTPD